MADFAEGQTALLLAVPEAEPVVGPWRARYDSSAGYGVPPHVTVLFPFLHRDRLGDGVLAELAALFAAEPATTLTFHSCGRFLGAVLYLAPEPVGWCRRLTGRVAARWPEAPPYGGAYPDVVPHLTVAEGDEVVLDEAERAVTPGLPVVARVGEVSLIGFAGGRWRPLAAFALRG